jgi:hypothetical protein
MEGNIDGDALLQAEAFVHQALQARAVENIVGKFFVGKHAQRGAAGVRGYFRRLFEGEIGILANHRHHHAHHHLQAPQPPGLVHLVIITITIIIFIIVLARVSTFSIRWFGPTNFHTAPFKTPDHLATPVAPGPGVIVYWMLTPSVALSRRSPF